MTALDNPAALPVMTRSARGFLSRLGAAIDRAVSGLAARKVSEEQLRVVECEIDRYLSRARAEKRRS